MTYQVQLDVYEGPLNLLLNLISEKALDVCDFPVAELTSAYLASLDQMKAMDLEVTTEFLVVAATLLQLKSRALLPQDDEVEIEWNSERDVLVARLLEAQTFQQAGQWLGDLFKEREGWYTSRCASDDNYVRALPSLSGIDSTKLGRILFELVNSMDPKVDVSLLVADEVDMAQALEVLEAYLERGLFSFRDLAGGRSVPWAIALFLVVIDAASRGRLALSQAEVLGEIEIKAVA